MVESRYSEHGKGPDCHEYLIAVLNVLNISKTVDHLRGEKLA